MTHGRVLLAAGLLSLSFACKKEEPAPPPAPPPAAKPEAEAAKPPPAPAGPKVGLVTDVGGRGDQSFNDSALRGLELWAGGKKFAGGGYQDAPADEVKASVPQDLAQRDPP